MPLPDLTGPDLLAWLNQTSSHWRALLTAHPETLAFPCDIRETNTAAELLQHIVAVELRYAERLASLAETPYEAIPHDAVESIYKIHDQAMRLVLSLTEQDDAWWHQPITFSTRSGGTMTSPRQPVFVHLCMHSIRHYAQLATIVRQHGVAPDWPMDYLYMRPR